ncbi:hypothetical protein DFR81_103170 [Garciella nitratireducens]|nr:hypothetical protein DFR81_103170 [Garciella nitratireducens]
MIKLFITFGIILLLLIGLTLSPIEFLDRVSKNFFLKTES